MEIQENKRPSPRKSKQLKQSFILTFKKWFFLWMSKCAWICVKLDFITKQETQFILYLYLWSVDTFTFCSWYWTIAFETRRLCRLSVPRQIHCRHSTPILDTKCYFFLFSNKSMNYDNGLPWINVSIGVLYSILFQMKDLLLTRIVHNFWIK